MQTAGGLVGLAGKLSARVEDRHDHFKRGLAGMLGVRIDRNAAAVVAHAQGAVRLQLDLDGAGVAGHGLVHRVVEHFGK